MAGGLRYARALRGGPAPGLDGGVRGGVGHARALAGASRSRIALGGVASQRRYAGLSSRCLGRGGVFNRSHRNRRHGPAERRGARYKCELAVVDGAALVCRIGPAAGADGACLCGNGPPPPPRARVRRGVRFATRSGRARSRAGVDADGVRRPAPGAVSARRRTRLERGTVGDGRSPRTGARRARRCGDAPGRARGRELAVVEIDRAAIAVKKA